MSLEWLQSKAMITKLHDVFMPFFTGSEYLGCIEGRMKRLTNNGAAVLFYGPDGP